jgi:hypothetical protein
MVRVNWKLHQSLKYYNVLHMSNSFSNHRKKCLKIWQNIVCMYVHKAYMNFNGKIYVEFSTLLCIKTPPGPQF